MSGKVIFTITYRSRLNELLDEIKHFWSLEVCDDESIKKKLETMLERTNYVLKIFFVCIFATEVLIAIAPLFTKDIAVGAWTLDGHNLLFKFTLAVQEIILFFIFTTFTFIIDCIFLVLFIYLIVQYKILNYAFKRLHRSNSISFHKGRQCYPSLKLCIKHHKFLLRYTKKLRDIVSPIMLIEYVTTAVLFCTEMYMFIESNNIQESIRRPVSFCAVLFQLAFYCIPANYVTGEALTLSDAIYESDWTSKYSPDERKSLLFVIYRSQQPIVFTGGRLVNIDAKTLINVVKISWSVCTILQRVKAKNQYSDSYLKK